MRTLRNKIREHFDRQSRLESPFTQVKLQPVVIVPSAHDTWAAKTRTSQTHLGSFKAVKTWQMYKDPLSPVIYSSQLILLE